MTSRRPGIFGILARITYHRRITGTTSRRLGIFGILAGIRYHRRITV